MASYAGFSINKSLEILKNYKKTINENTEIDKVKFRLSSEFFSMRKMANELLIIIDDYSAPLSKDILLFFINQINSDLKIIDNIKTINEAKEIIDRYYIYYEKEYFKAISKHDFSDTIYKLSHQTYLSYEELTRTDCSLIMDSININREFNIFSTIARKGYSLRSLKEASLDKAITYGLEKDTDAMITLKTNCDKTIKGTLNGSRISNDVFDMMYLCPFISWEAEYNELGSLKEKSEKLILRYHIKHLRKNGIMIFTIPFFRLTKDMNILIAKLLDNVQVIKKDNTSFQQVIIIGTKNQTKDAKNNIYEYLNNLNYDDIGRTLDKIYSLPTGGIQEPELFRGSVLDFEEIQSLIDNSGLMDSFWDKNKIEDNTQSTRPLMPFNMGQIGLVLTSGCLDGVVEEYEGQYHAIKGMVTKIKHVDTTVDDDDKETTVETISNKVQINIVTPDGQFIELA